MPQGGSTSIEIHIKNYIVTNRNTPQQSPQQSLNILIHLNAAQICSQVETMLVLSICQQYLQNTVYAIYRQQFWQLGCEW
jgi:hypothetical protein